MSTQPKGLGPLLAVNFSGSLGYAIVMPFLVFIVMQWGGDAIIYGLVGATYSVFQFIGSPVLGRWSDFWGRKRVLLLSQAGSVLSWVIALVGFHVPLITLMNVDSSLLGKFTLTLPLLLLFLARALDGLTGGNVSVANAYVADISPPQQRSANFGKLSASANAGAVLGPALAGLLVGTALGYELPIVVAAIVCFGATLMIWFGLPNSTPGTPAAKNPTPSSASLLTGQNHTATATTPHKTSVATILSLQHIPLLLSASFLVYLAFSIFNITLPMYVVQTLGWSPGKMGLFYAVMGFVMVFVEGPGLRKISGVFSSPMLIAVGGLILGLGFLTLDTSADGIVFTGAVLIGVGNGLIWPLLLALLSEKAGDHQGAAQGLAGSTGAVATIIGLLIGGFLYGPLQGWLFALAALFSFILTLMALWAGRSN